MSKSTSEANEILSNIFLTSKEERERKEREAEEAEVDKGAPTIEAQLPTFHTPVSFAFDEDLHWMTTDFGEPLKSEGSLPQDQSTGELLPKWFKPNQEEMLTTTPQKRSVSMFEEEEDQLLAFKTTEASSSLVEVKTPELPSIYIEESLPSDKLVDEFITREMMQNFQDNPHSVAADTTEESEDEWRRHYQSDWIYSACSSSLKKDSRYSATSSFVNTVCATQDLTPEN